MRRETLPEGMDSSNVTTRRTSRAESKDILEMIDMYSKLSLDCDLEDDGAEEEENPSTKEFVQTTTILLKTLGEKLVEKIDHITFLQEENILLKTTMKMEMNEVKDNNDRFYDFISAKVDRLNEKFDNEKTVHSSTPQPSRPSSSSAASTSYCSSTSTPSKEAPSVTTVRTLELEEEVKFLKYELISKNRVIDYLMDARAIDTNDVFMTNDEVDDEEDEDTDTPPSNIDDDIVHDCTIEIIERLLEENLPAKSAIEADLTSVSVESTIVRDEREDTERNWMDGGVDQKDVSTEEMLSVAPWDVHSNGFATKYMRKNGHEPGMGLGKSGNGITEPISAAKNTLDASIDVPTWQRGTTLIAGASIIQGLDETKMSRSGKVKVRSHGGATIKDMRDHLTAHLRKKPDLLIIHVHSNDASINETTADDMFDRLMDLKNFAEEKVPTIKVTFSCPIIRTDNVLANFKQIQLKNRLKRSGLDIVLNDNIEKDDLGKKGLHLKPGGSSKLAKNFIDYLKGV